MASQVSQILASPHTSIPCNMENRPKADFHPGIWGDIFLNCPNEDIDTATQLRYGELKEEVRRMLVAPMGDNSTQKLPLIDAVQRWWKDLDFTKKLPFARDRVIEGYFWIMGMIRLAQAYLLEAKWTHQNYKPTFEEFRDNALPTSGYGMLAITAFVGMGDVITPETFAWATNDPKIIKASTIICRFMDDIAEHKFKHRREDDCSAIECYMEQYGVTAQEAYDEFNKHIESSWKDINEEFLKPTEMPVPVLNRSLNLARVMDVLYREGDGYTHVGKAAKGGITSLLIDPIPL
ncbi:(+)-delta-cadinene synthase isozyme A [Gossypium australe]|uniref:(+)-delta-cadinene synthase isozyme A n=1 Tax=Gossypium australe TaxID=47621 RepID=A0A5B6V7G3_9ROSI|nr:(+)-delta-cadinene synthase isozyme A [Gossypium australe]KAA3465139.1 (+)-delta-cadinene synthase isozyme A [Gossypium australe]